uniref:(northern house mosquito) hypothetical protein n=1 Tax=Culex pipiens TaxID=7175 RepID=A0A8D8J3N2_CULPI
MSCSSGSGSSFSWFAFWAAKCSRMVKSAFSHCCLKVNARLTCSTHWTHICAGKPSFGETLTFATVISIESRLEPNRGRIFCFLDMQLRQISSRFMKAQSLSKVLIFF